MLSKIWKKVGLIILIIACVWNIVFKLVNKISFDGLIKSTKAELEQENKTNENTTNQNATNENTTKEVKKKK